MKRTIYHGRVVNTSTQHKLEILENVSIGVNEEGLIVWLSSGTNAIEAGRRKGWPDATIVQSEGKTFFFPGFIDTHIHASQYPNTGIFGESTLLDWLNNYIYPLEASLADQTRARAVYEKCVDRTLKYGTTTAAYFGTCDVNSTNICADVCLARGQRAFVGRCCMNAQSPEYYCDRSDIDALHKTFQTIRHIKAIDPKYSLVTPIITPRFAPSCTKSLLKELALLAKKENLPVQTHINENLAEVQWVKELFPDSRSYADVYDQAGLLTPRTVLAHAVHCTSEEVALMAERGVGVSHCPCSNSALRSGDAHVHALLDAGINVGLGTDISGGYSASILEVARQAAFASRRVKRSLSVAQLLYLATHGGAKVLHIADKTGTIEIGKFWDACLVDLEVLDSPVDFFPWQDNILELIDKWFYCGDDRNIVNVWSKGHQLKGR